MFHVIVKCVTGVRDVWHLLHRSPRVPICRVLSYTITIKRTIICAQHAFVADYMLGDSSGQFDGLTTNTPITDLNSIISTVAYPGFEGGRC